VHLGLGHNDERAIYLDEDVYVVIGDGVRAATRRSVWPQIGAYGPTA
jgi:hypothetical protein